jgi:aspartyl-tRNA synthetase
LLGKNYIRDCTAFYLNQDGVDPMMKSPMPLTDLELRDMGLKLLPKK